MVDQELAKLSDLFFWLTTGLYAVAAVLLLAHFAFRTRLPAVVGTAAGWIGALLHVTSIVTRGMAAGRVPWGNMYEYSSVIALLLVLVQLLYADTRKGMRSVGGFTFALALLTLGLARSLYVPARELQPALGGLWLKVHVAAAIIGTAMFSISFVYSALFLLRLRTDRRLGSTVGAAHVTAFDETDHASSAASSGRGGRATRLPEAKRLDELAHDSVKLGFPVWTFAVIAGAIWAHEAWGRYWGWDPKETWALITWIVYAAYLHARATAGWRDRKAAILNVASFGVILFTYYAVNLWIPGLHSYANG